MSALSEVSSEAVSDLPEALASSGSVAPIGTFVYPAVASEDRSESDCRQVVEVSINAALLRDISSGDDGVQFREGWWHGHAGK